MRGVGGEVVVEAVTQGGLHQARGFRAGKFFLCLALELRVAQEDGELGGELAGDVFGGDRECALVGALLAPGAQGFQQRVAEARLVRAAGRRGDGVGVGIQEGFAVLQPDRGPFHAAAWAAVGAVREVGLAGPDFGQGAGVAFYVGLQGVLQAAGEMQDGFRGRGVAYQRRVAGPAYFHAAEQVGLGAAEFVEAGWAELQRAEDLRVRLEAYGGAAAVLRGAGVYEFRCWCSAGVALAVEHAVPRHLHVQRFGQRVDDRAAYAVQAA